MEFAYSDKVTGLQDKLGDFMDRHVYPNEAQHAREIETGDRWQPTALMEDLKKKARLEGLWNLFLPHSPRGAGLSNLEYAPLCEIMGRAPMASEVFNCSAPDTGNMETLELYGNEAQKEQWLKPLLAGEIRSLLRHDRARRRLVRRHQHREHHPARRRSLRDQRPQMVDDRRARSALQDRDLHGQDRSAEPRPSSPAIDDPGADGRTRREGAADTLGVRLRRCPARPRRGALRQCPRAAREHPAGRRPRLRDRPGPARPRPHPSLHASHRPGRAGPRGHVQAREIAGCLRQAAQRADRHAGAHRRGAHHDRAGAAAGAQGRLHDGHGGQQGGARRDRHDQGRRAEDADERGRHGDPGPWWRQASPATSASPRLMRWRARCACSTVPTRFIATRSAGWNSPSTIER